ncbi:hypothetical protein [Citrobacter sp. Cpo126]|uniref:hypothetical protein n=1 Tax=Citrobacter TaxID=544 RepID=UPI002574BE50|nr:hypothetical protein [Citrobacter sp. Cpo126]MBJ8832541.1 hypothetical protein [Citrobacter freundii]MDM2773401.1 hypothetical protein [Citrobacter sp. Cpo126]
MRNKELMMTPPINPKWSIKMFKKSVVAVLIVLPMSAFAHGHGGHGGMGGHNFGGHGHGGNIGHAFSGHSFGGHIAERMNAGGGFTGFSKGSINMSDHPIADNTTRSISVKDGVVTKNIAYNGVNEQYSATTTISQETGVVRTSTVTRDGVTKTASTVVSPEMRSHTVDVTNGDVTHFSDHSYVEGVGGLSIHGTKEGDEAIGTVTAYNDVSNAVKTTHALKNADLTRVASTVIAPTMRTHNVMVKEGDLTITHLRGYVGNETVGYGFSKGVAKEDGYAIETSVNSLGIATVGAYGPSHYAEKAENLKTGEVKTITDITPPQPQPTPVVVHVVPVTPLTPATPVNPPVVVHVVPASTITPATPATTVYNDKLGDSVILYWNI